MLNCGWEVVGTPETVAVAPGIDAIRAVVATIERSGGFIIRAKEANLQAVFRFEQDKLDQMLTGHRMLLGANLHAEGVLVAEINVRKVFLTDTGFFAHLGAEELHLTTTAMRGDTGVD